MKVSKTHRRIVVIAFITMFTIAGVSLILFTYPNISIVECVINKVIGGFFILIALVAIKGLWKSLTWKRNKDSDLRCLIVRTEDFKRAKADLKRLGYFEPKSLEQVIQEDNEEGVEYEAQIEYKVKSIIEDEEEGVDNT